VEQFEPIRTPVGIINGRDAIYLDEIHLDLVKANTLALQGELSPFAGSERESDDWITYTLVFFGICGLKVTELDSWDFKCASSFDEVKDSEFLKSFKLDMEHKHYKVQTYDYVFDVVCRRFDFSLGARRKQAS
jgi:hypothetical protein